MCQSDSDTKYSFVKYNISREDWSCTNQAFTLVSSGVYYHLSSIIHQLYLYIGEQRCVYHFRRFFNKLSSSTICRRSYTKCNFTLVCNGVSTICQRLCPSGKSTLEWSGVLQVCRRVSTIGVYIEGAEKRFYNKRKIALRIADRWWRTLSREIEDALRSGNLLRSEEADWYRKAVLTSREAEQFNVSGNSNMKWTLIFVILT